MIDWAATGSVASNGENGRRVVLFGPAFNRLPESLALRIDKVHLAQSGHTDITIPWAEYARSADVDKLESWPADGAGAGRWIVRLPETAAFRLPTVHGSLHVVGIDPVSRAVVMEFHGAGGRSITGEIWPLAPYTFGNNLRTTDGRPYSGNSSTQMWENDGRHYYVIEIPVRFAEDNDTFILRFEKRGQDVEVNASWPVELRD